MSYTYTPTPARSEPATVSGRSLSSDAGIGAHATRLRRTYSVPSSFPTNRPHGQQRRPGMLGLGIGLPTTLVAGFHPRPERPRMRRQADLGLGTPFTAIPTRSIRRRVPGTFPMSPAARSRSGAGTTHGLGIAMQRRVGDNTRLQCAPEHAPHPAITLTLADAFDSEGEENGAADEHDASRYAFLPPGLSSPVEQTSPTALSMYVASPTVRPMTFRRLASPGMRAAGDTTLPGAPLSPSLSRFGTHHHFPGLDHSAGGMGDEDALLVGSTGLSTPSRSRTRMPMTPPNAPRAPWVERFSNDRLYH